MSKHNHQSTQQGDSELIQQDGTTFTQLPLVPHNTYLEYQLRPVRLIIDEDGSQQWVKSSLKKADVIGLYGIPHNGLPVWIADLPIIH